MLRSSATVLLFPSPQRVWRRSERGSVFFIVLALLSLLVLILTTMLYVGRLEVLASNNAGRSVQARMAAATGVATAARAIPKDAQQFTALTQDWAIGWGSLAQEKSAESKLTSGSQNILPLSRVAVLDESSLININAIVSTPQLAASIDGASTETFDTAFTEKMFAQFVEQRLSKAGLQTKEAPAIARTILQARLGTDDKAGKEKNAEKLLSSKVDQSQDAGIEVSSADLRVKPKGSDIPFRTLADLKRSTGMSDAVLEALSPYLTTFSSSPETWRDREQRDFVRLSLNEISEMEITAALKALYPEAEDMLLAQFAVNVIDRRDADSIPTVYPTSLGIYPVMGFEFTPVISEVAPDVATLDEDNDYGEYIEIFNPFDTAVELKGWRLDWASGDITLNHTLPAGGTLIITDNIKDDNNPKPVTDAPGMGSFFDVFHILPAGLHSQIQEHEGMDIPNESGMVRLLDKDGNLIDYLVYRGGDFNGMNRGFMKLSPFSHLGRPSQATPFQPDLTKPATEYAETRRAILYERMNKEFTSPAELLAIPAEYLVVTQPERSMPWSFPQMVDSSEKIPDARMLDAFTVLPMHGLGTTADHELKVWDAAKSPRELARLASASDAQADEAVDAPIEEKAAFEAVSFGKINLNTASEEILRILPGFDKNLVEKILKVREQTLANATKSPENSEKEAPFASLSDFALNEKVWANVSEADRLKALLAVTPLVTIRSSSFRIVSANAADPVREGKRPNQIACEAQVHVDGEGCNVISWHFQTPSAPSVDTTNKPSPTHKPEQQTREISAPVAEAKTGR